MWAFRALAEKLAQSQNQPHTDELCGAWLVAAIFRDAFFIVLYFTIEKQVYPVSDPPNIQQKYRLMFCTFSRLLYAERYGNIQYNGKGISGNRSHQPSPTQFACVGLISTLSSFFGKCSESPHRANRAVTWETFGALQTGFSPVPPWKRRCFPVPAECRSPGK